MSATHARPDAFPHNLLRAAHPPSALPEPAVIHAHHILALRAPTETERLQHARRAVELAEELHAGAVPELEAACRVILVHVLDTLYKALLDVGDYDAAGPLIVRIMALDTGDVTGFHAAKREMERQLGRPVVI